MVVYTSRGAKFKHVILTILKYFSLILWAVICIAPILTVFFAAFKSRLEYYGNNKIALPHSFLYLNNFVTYCIKGNVLTGIKNTTLILVTSLAGAIIIGAMVAFVLNRFEFKGKKIILGLYLGAMLIPMVTNQVSTYKIIDSMNLIDTLAAPVLLYLGADVISIYLMLLFIGSVPVSCDESAMLDGASYPMIFFRIILPNLKPAIVTVGLIKGVAIYNDFYIPQLYMPSPENATLSTSLFSFIGPYGGEWQVICAGVVIILIPTLVIFLSLQKYIYNGFISGSVKS
jgi:ABC-type glycerol-3-phosphate transport system permease component